MDPQTLFDSAEKKRNGLSFLFYNTNKMSEAAELYEKSAVLWKSQKVFLQAGNAFVNSAHCLLKSPEKDVFKAANMHVQASQCYQKAFSKNANLELVVAIGLYISEGHMSRAAKYEKELALIFKADDNTMEAILWFEKAADHFGINDERYSQESCLLEAVFLYMKMNNFQKAIQVMENLFPLTNKFKTRSMCFVFLLCFLLQNDLVGAQRALIKCQNEDYGFYNSKEDVCIKSLMEAVESQNLDLFQSSIEILGQVENLDPLTVTLLLKLKDSLGDHKSEEDVSDEASNLM